MPLHIKHIRSKDGTGTLSHLLIDEETSSALLIDPNLEDVETISLLIRMQSVKLTHIIDTHTHADHISAAAELQKRFSALIVMHENTKNKWRIVDQGDAFGIGDILRSNAKIPIDMYVNDGDIITVGKHKAEILFTPGHTDNHITVKIGNHIFTGDLLLIGQAGRSDLPGGDPGEQYDSLMKKILLLPDETLMYPGHDYEGRTHAVLGDEKKTNPFLAARTKQDYIDFVAGFFPPLAESTNGGNTTLQCGVQRVAQPEEGIRQINPLELHKMITLGEKLHLLDVRDAHELSSLGAIEGVQNIAVRQLPSRLNELPEEQSMPIVAICASGSRSIEAAHLLRRAGYSNIMNLKGGTIGWMAAGLPLVRSTHKSGVRI